MLLKVWSRIFFFHSTFFFNTRPTLSPQFVRFISADALIGMGEMSKCSYIQKVFMDSYKSPLSMILIDDIERIIDYTPLGPRFSNMVLQTLLVLLKKAPPKNKRLFIVGTTSIAHLLEDLQVRGRVGVLEG